MNFYLKKFTNELHFSKKLAFNFFSKTNFTAEREKIRKKKNFSK